MNDFVHAFEERVQEIETYLELLDALEKQVQGGPPRIGDAGPIITVEQQKILYSSVYLQLYNLVESTVTRCVEAISTAIVENGSWFPGDLSADLRREWVRSIARTHTEINHENRLESALLLCEHLVQTLPVSPFKFDKGAGGSWDDVAIQDISRRLGLSLAVSPSAFSGIKKHFRNDQGTLAFIKTLRNNLAHGSLSFVECGDGVTVNDLRELKERTVLYLREVVLLFKAYIDSHEFLLPDRRPKGTGTTA
jgi:hypothetical protein